MDYIDNITQLLSGWEGRPPETETLIERLEIEDKKGFIEWLEGAMEEGVLVKSRRGGWMLPMQAGMIAGKIRITFKGTAFLLPMDPESERLIIPPSKKGGAMDGDTVLGSLSGGPPNRNGLMEVGVSKILKRARTRIVGRFEKAEQGAYVVPDSSSIHADMLIGGDYLGAKNGDKVVAEITLYPTQRRGPEGKIVEVLGSADDVGVDILSIAREMGLPEEFPDAVLAAAQKVPDTITDVQGRMDLRGQCIFTIDGADAKDLDDAVSIEKMDNGNYRLGVHIADVSHYVAKGSVLDKEAIERGTSVYLIDRVIPMLPQQLSNGICSLHQGVDRLTLSCLMEIDKQGKVLDFELGDSVIHSVARLTYDQAQSIIDGEDHPVPGVAKNLRMMQDLADILRRMRTRRGAIDLDLDESHIELDSNGIPTHITSRERKDSHKLIEEFMLCANSTVAEWAQSLDIPFAYRVHKEPKPEKILELDAFVHNFGLRIHGLKGGIHPQALQKLLEDAGDGPAADIISRVMLRSLQKAEYSPINSGHFGLAAKFYCHFTSPIRRYPDLIVHRCIKAMQRGEMQGKYARRLEKEMPGITQHCTDREILSMKAERAVDDLKMTEYMTYHVGEEFEGTISGVTEFGFFVELDNLVEGLVRMQALDDDFYVFDKQLHCLVGRRRKKVFRLGDRVKVKCVRADISSRQIDFELV